MSDPARSAVPLYDQFSDYDRLVNWERRLAYELPFIEAQLQAAGAHRALDVACGTGRHAIALSERGYDVVGADLSAPMIERARTNARERASVGSQGRATFLVAGFGELAARTGLAGSDRGDLGKAATRFDALLCLGNSLPHVLTEVELRATLTDFSGVLRPAGVLLVQMRNMNVILAARERWMPLQERAVEGGREWLFVRFYDLGEDGITFNVVTLERHAGELWRQRVDSTLLYPWRRDQLVDALGEAGFVDVTCYGDMAGGGFDEAKSGNLVLVAKRA